jgi:hypothetical protein
LRQKVLKGLREKYEGSVVGHEYCVARMEWAELGQNMKGESGPPPDIFRKRAILPPSKQKWA